MAMKGERGSILGLWTANLPDQKVELVFRQDGEFRLTRCQHGAISHDYGLYRADVNARTLVSDSRFTPVQAHGLDFYGDTLRMFGGSPGGPSTCTVHLGVVDAAMEASLAADTAKAAVDAQWTAPSQCRPPPHRDPSRGSESRPHLQRADRVQELPALPSVDSGLRILQPPRNHQERGGGEYPSMALRSHRAGPGSFQELLNCKIHAPT